MIVNIRKLMKTLFNSFISTIHVCSSIIFMKVYTGICIYSMKNILLWFDVIVNFSYFQHSIDIVHSSSRRPFVNSHLYIYIDGNLKLDSQLKFPNVSDVSLQNKEKLIKRSCRIQCTCLIISINGFLCPDEIKDQRLLVVFFQVLSWSNLYLKKLCGQDQKFYCSIIITHCLEVQCIWMLFFFYFFSPWQTVG